MEQVLDEFGRRLRDFQALDAGRSKFTEVILSQLREVVVKLKKAEEDCEVEAMMKSYYQQQIRNLEKQVKATVARYPGQGRTHLTRCQEKRSFVVVVIDADGDPYMFHPTLLEQGGEHAADELQKKVREYLRSFPEDSEDFEIIVKAFAGLDKLGSTLTANARIRSEGQLRHFVANFNKRSTFFDFIDVGFGKERADQKVRENVKFYLDIPQCKRIFLACCHDGGYVTFLENLIQDSRVERMTLIEGDSVAFGFQQLNLRTTSFPSVFHGLKSINVSSQHSKKFKIEMTPQQARKLAAPSSNSAGERRDVPLSVDPNLLKDIESFNLCHWLFLRGECRGCHRNHSHFPLTDPEFDALWLLARQGLCRAWKQQGRCEDGRCIYGHGQY